MNRVKNIILKLISTLLMKNLLKTVKKPQLKKLMKIKINNNKTINYDINKKSTIFNFFKKAIINS